MKELLRLVEESIANIDFPKQPAGLYEPARYMMSLGGKRVRPLLLLMCSQLYGGKLNNAISTAMAFEVFHNFTLMHDDLMDKADQRRGNVTIHQRWNENTAILSGDAMLVTAYRLLTQSPKAVLPQLLELFTATAAEVCEGQQYDMEFEKRLDVTRAEYLEMIRLKTAVLLGACLKAGAILGNAPSGDAELVYDFGVKMGMAFQLKDDLLDVYGDAVVFGKRIGGDILCNKKTFLLINALERAQGADRKKLEQWLTVESVNPDEKIAAVTAIYDKLHLYTMCTEKMGQHYDEAMDCLLHLSVPQERLEPLKSMAQQLMNREA